MADYTWACIKLKNTIKKLNLPMWPVSGEVWPVMGSMNNRVRAGFDADGKEARLCYVWCRVHVELHKIALHLWKLHRTSVYLDTNWVNEGKY
jgi:hypothetical protein